MRGISAGIFVGTLFITVCIQALYLLAAVKIVTKKFIDVRKAFALALGIFVFTLVFGRISVAILFLSRLFLAMLQPITSVTIAFKQILAYSIIYLPVFLVSWLLISVFITKGEFGEKDFLKGIKVTLTMYALSFIANYLWNLLPGVI